MGLLSWRNVIIAAVVVSLLAVIYNRVYETGYKAAALEYETKLSDQKDLYIKEQEAIKSKAYQTGLNAAEKRQEVTTVYVPVEKEIIKYVSKPVDSGCNVEFVTDWVQLHNRAANPNLHTDQTGRAINDSSTGDTGGNRTGSRPAQ